MNAGELRRDVPFMNDPASEICGNLDTGLIKIIALVFMIVDHVGASVFKGIPELRVLGRIALPLYAWCLVVGSVRTRNPLRYSLRLLVQAVLCQPLYMMALNHTYTDFNILFLLCLGSLMLWGIRANQYGSRYWAPILCFLVLGFVKIDYGWRGLLFILLLYAGRRNKAGLTASYLAYAMFWGASYSVTSSFFGIPFPFLRWPGIGDVISPLFKLQSFIWLSLPLILIRTRSGIRMSKPVSYALYPAHLVGIILLKLAMGFTWASITNGFR